MRTLRTVVIAVAFLSAADLRATPPAAPLVCPVTERERLLREAPAALAPCADAARWSDVTWSALAAPDPATAAGRFDRARSLAPEDVRPVLALEAARAWLDAGKPALTLERIGEPVPDGWLGARTWPLLARARLETGDAAGARTAARAAKGDAPAMQRVLLLASLATKDHAGAEAALLELRTRHPGSSEARDAEEIATKAGLSTLAKLGPKQLAARWKSWAGAGGAGEVAAECVARLEGRTGVGNDLGEARYQCGAALSTLRRDTAEAMLIDAARSKTVRADALLAAARVRGRRGVAGPVEELCAQLATVPKSSGEQAECDYLAAFLLLDGGDTARSEAALERVADRHPKHARGRDARWLLAIDRMKRDPVKAAADFGAMAEATNRADERAPALYWRGRLRLATAPDAARADLQEARRLDPIGYYGWLASARLGELPAEATTGCAPRPMVAATPPEWATRVSLLLDAGLRDAAAAELAAVSPKADDGSLIAFLRATNQFRRLLQVAGRTPAVALPLSDATKAALERHYPIAWPDALSGVPASVDRCLVLSLMRRESLFDPEAVSSARARGLLQLLPVTATQVARELGLPAPQPDALHDPTLNVRLAGRYLERLLARFKNPLLAAAAYNGGPKAVARWLDERSGMELDEFVERIPYRETRHYVKAVGGAWATYGVVYEGRLPPLSLAPVAKAGEGIDF